MAEHHLKAHILRLLAQRGAMWDRDVATEVTAAYGLSGDYWYGTVRVTLTDLFSSGLLTELDTAVDPDTHSGRHKLLFKFALNDFGRERMAETGLLEDAR